MGAIQPPSSKFFYIKRGLKMSNIKTEIDEIFNKTPKKEVAKKSTKFIPKEWYPSIFNLTVASGKIQPFETVVKVKEKTIIFYFNSEEQKKEFYKNFVVNLFPAMNNLIKSKKEEPGNFN